MIGLRKLFDRVTGREAARLRDARRRAEKKLETHRRNHRREVDHVRRLALDHGVYIYPKIEDWVDVTNVWDDTRRFRPGTWRWEAAELPDDAEEFDLAERPS